ncbi:WD40 repeat domain-containing protein [Solihabitans fulvus]|uniref:WD40 repeat domain-containing protein n=1 Tax=Solihabitans fulvus TaxID=1892852 RepID=UPI001CB75E8C|nr:WD40 repeat domain-containing protein [Solihabitans fulvus]
MEAGLGFTTIAGYCTGRHLPQLSVGGEFSRLLTAMGVPAGEAHEAWFARLATLRSRVTRPAAANRNPYLGLRAFEPSDADVYFGRADLAARLVDEVNRRGGGGAPLIVVGASGSGKSSLLRAGLIPAVGSSVLFTPGTKPMLEWTKHTAEADDEAVVVIDQFEELFTLCSDDAARSAFVDAMLGWPGAVVLGLRANLYDRALEHPKLAVLLQSNQIVVEPMDERQLREVIVEPATAAGLELQDGLVDLVLRDTAREPGVLPLLSHTLRTVVELSRQQVSDRASIRIEHYRAAGGVHGAVARTADDAYRALSAERRTVARNLFLRLVQTDKNVADTRRRVTFDELFGGRSSTESDVIAEVLDLFVGRRLLTTGAETVEISHECLLSAWPLLQRWLAEDRIGQHVHGRLTAAARSWHEDGRPQEGLYRGGLLETALDWAAEPGPRDAINPLERDFLDASVADRSARVAAERREVRRRYQSASAVLVLLLVAAGAGLYAHQVSSNADHEAEVALSRQITGKAIRLREKDPALAAQLALTAYQVAPTQEARGALLDTSARPMPRRLRADATTSSAADSLLAIGTAAGTVQLYQTGSDGAATRLGPELRLAGPVDVVSLSADATMLAAGTRSGAVAAWRLADPAQPKALPVPAAGSARIFGLAFSQDDSLLAAGEGDATTRIWDLTGSAPPTSLTGPDQAVKSVAFVPHGRIVAAGSDDGTVHLWDAAVPNRPTALPTLTGPTSRIFTVAVSPDGQTLAAGTAAEHSVYTWHIADPTRPTSSGPPLTGPASWINTLAFSPDGGTLAAGSSDTKLWQWDLHGRGVLTVLPHPAPVTSAVYRDAHTLITTAGDNVTRTWPLPGPLLTGSTNQIFSTAYDAAGDRLLVGAGDHNLRLWDLTDPAHPAGGYPALSAPAGFGQLVGASVLSPDGRTAIGGAGDGTIDLWSLADPANPVRLGAPVQVGKSTIQAITFDPAGRMLAVSSDDGTVHLLDVTDPARPVIVSTLSVGVTAYGVRFSPDGRLLAAASGDGAGLLWNVADRAHPRLLHTVTGFTGPAYAVAFSPDGRVLAFGGADYTARLVDLSRPDAPRQLEPRLIGPVGEIYDLAFDPAGSVLAIASIDRTIWLWDLRVPARPALLATLSAADDGLFTVAFSPAGHILVAGGRDTAVRLWNTTPDLVARSICATAGDPITRSEWDQFIPGKPYTPPC